MGVVFVGEGNILAEAAVTWGGDGRPESGFTHKEASSRGDLLLLVSHMQVSFNAPIKVLKWSG